MGDLWFIEICEPGGFSLSKIRIYRSPELVLAFRCQIGQAKFGGFPLRDSSWENWSSQGLLEANLCVPEPRVFPSAKICSLEWRSCHTTKELKSVVQEFPRSFSTTLKQPRLHSPQLPKPLPHSSKSSLAKPSPLSGTWHTSLPPPLTSVSAMLW